MQRVHMAADGFEMRVEVSAGRAVSAGVALPADHRPGRTPVVVLAHGAGTDRRHPSIVAIQDGLAAAGWPTVVFNFPYREAGRRIPDARPVLEGCWRAVVEAVRIEPRLSPPWVAIGGRSMGGRIASHVAADGAPVGVRGLVFLGFPLHPAGRPATDRAAHLARIAAPMLFVQGTKDALADATLLAEVLGRLPQAEVHWLAGADHSFRVPRRSGRDDAEVRAEIVGRVTSWLDNLPD
jgi:predicted alpha/beta-hydrolase family hydrolase